MTGHHPERRRDVVLGDALQELRLVGEHLAELGVARLLVDDVHALHLRDGVQLLVDRGELALSRVGFHEDAELHAALPLEGGPVGTPLDEQGPAHQSE